MTVMQRMVPRKCILYQLKGLVPYKRAWDLQKQLIRERWENPEAKDVIIALQHPSVFTIGRGGSLANVKFDPENSPHELVRVDRGGEVTYHGPGQLVMYPILNLRHHKKDLHWYLRQVEEVVIQTLARYQLTGERIDGLTGVWVNDQKIAAVGTHASKWITMHGLALNVTTDLRPFHENIIPCGIQDRAVGNMEQLVPQVKFQDVEQTAIRTFCDQFKMEIDERYTDFPHAPSSVELNNGGTPAARVNPIL